MPRPFYYRPRHVPSTVSSAVPSCRALRRPLQSPRAHQLGRPGGPDPAREQRTKPARRPYAHSIPSVGWSRSTAEISQPLGYSSRAARAAERRGRGEERRPQTAERVGRYLTIRAHLPDGPTTRLRFCPGIKERLEKKDTATTCSACTFVFRKRKRPRHFILFL